MPTRPINRALLVLLIAGLPLAAVSCASRTPISEAQAPSRDRAIAPAISEIEDLAQRQSRTPVPSDFPVPSGLDASLVQPLQPVPPEARTSLRELLPTLASEVPFKNPDPPATPPDEVAREAALRLYARARAAAIADKPANAIAFLDEAAKADPTRPEIWRLRGDILSNTSQRFGATAAYQRAVDLGIVESRAYLALGQAALDRADDAAAARLLAAAIERHADGEDPALPVIARGSLGPALHKLGYTNAGSEALLEAAGASLQFTATTAFRTDLQSLARRRSDLARDAGDGWSRLGETPKALAAYDLASALPSFDPSAISERRVYVLARAGMPAGASLTLLDDIANAGLRIDDRQLELLGLLANHSDLGPLLARAVAELPALARHEAAISGSPAPRITPTIQSRLARAAVAIHPAGARGVLESHLIEFPSDADVCRAWVSLLGTDAAGAVSAATGLIDRQPLVAPTLALQLAQSPLGARIVESHADAAEVRSSAPHATLIASLRNARGEWADASSTLRQGPRSRSSPGIAAEALIAAAAGDVALTDSLLPSIQDPAQQGRILAALQRPDAASLAIESAIEHSPSVQTLIIGTEVAVLRRDAEHAESLLRRAIEIDPFDESLYERLAGLFRQGAPLADQDRLFGVYRDLREAVPSSRLLRTLNAQDAMQRNLFAQAEQELVSLIRSDPDDRRAMQTLLTAWERLAQSDPATMPRAVALLESLRAARPSSATLAIAYARALAAASPADARVFLEAHLADYPSDEVASSYEALVRGPVALPEEATAFAIARLSDLPRPIDATISLAREQSAAGMLFDAASTLERDLPPDSTLTPTQSATLQLMLADVAPAASTSNDLSLIRGTLRLIAVVAERAQGMAPGIHEIRISLLASDPEAKQGDLLDAITRARTDAPTLGSRPARAAIGSLVANDRNEEALAIVIDELQHGAPYDPELALAGVRLVVAAGKAADLRAVLESISTLDDAEKVLSPIHPDGDLALPHDATLDEARAEIAFIAANAMAVSDDRAADSHDLYRLALAFDPEHAMAANNLGYTLLEGERELTEAASLLELAFRLEPNDPNVIDSIGWLRYQQGIIDDVSNSDGSITEGAITLLERAVLVDASGGSPVSIDHYGDALWAGGQNQSAIDQWAHALATLERRMSEYAALGRSDPEHPALLASIESKLTAARADGEPKIAPMRLRNVSEAPPLDPAPPPASLHSREAPR